MLTPLPIDPALPEIVSRLRVGPALVLSAEPGAGKTTRVPRALLDAGLAGRGEVVVLQPRRLAARLAARRVADEHGEKLGGLVGYQVRFEEVCGPSTRLRFVTEGVLTRRLLADPSLPGVGVVVLDEFHERHLDGDLCLALLKRLTHGPRPDLRLVVMSATLDPTPLVRFLGGAPHLAVPGRPFDVAVEHASKVDDRPLETQVASAVRRLVDEGLGGDVLVFLPGAAEIRKAREALEPLARRADLLVLPLHGDLTADEQDRAVRAADRRKVILSTNVAETSVTIPGVVAVVDSGLARIAGHSPWSGLPTLKVGKVSKASVVQRTGRAGRVRAGRSLRLFTRHDFETRPEHEAPEIRRLDLAEAVLALHGAGVADPSAFEWFEAPEPAALSAAEELLRRLGALDASGALSELGRRMLKVPVHPRQARVLLEAEARGRGADGTVLAALLGEREIRLETRARFDGMRAQAKVSGPSDLLESLEAFREAERKGFDADRLRSMGLDAGAVRAVDRVRRQLARHVKASGPTADKDPDRPLLVATLAGYPDRLARRRAAGSADLFLSAGGTAALAETSVVREGMLLVAVDAEERGHSSAPGRSARAGTLVRSASLVEPEWLLDLFSDRMSESTEVTWNEVASRVDAVSRILFDDLVIEEGRAQANPAAVSRLLAERALARGLATFAEEGAVDGLLARVAFARQHAPNAGLPALTVEAMREALVGLCEGRRSFADLEAASLVDALRSRLAGAQQAQLDRLAPERVRLHSGRQVPVHYEAGKPPWIESRLQDFFGLAQGPSVAAGRVPLVLHLLAPNQRAVQMTTDLAGFWDRHYPAIRRELCRRYPRHAWPEDPRTATPPAPGPRRR